MSRNNSGNERNMDEMYETPRAEREPHETEIEYLTRQAEEAKRAMHRVARDVAHRAGAATHVRAWPVPWQILGAAVATAGFAAGILALSLRKKHRGVKLVRSIGPALALPVARHANGKLGRTAMQLIGPAGKLLLGILAAKIRHAAESAPVTPGPVPHFQHKPRFSDATDI